MTNFHPHQVLRQVHHSNSINFNPSLTTDFANPFTTDFTDPSTTDFTDPFTSRLRRQIHTNKTH